MPWLFGRLENGDKGEFGVQLRCSSCGGEVTLRRSATGMRSAPKGVALRNTTCLMVNAVVIEAAPPESMPSE
jgi:hypothetical protein